MREQNNSAAYTARWMIPNADGSLHPTVSRPLASPNKVPERPFPLNAVGYEIVKNQLTVVGRVFIEPLLLSKEEKLERGDKPNANIMRLSTVQSPSYRSLAYERSRIGSAAIGQLKNQVLAKAPEKLTALTDAEIDGEINAILQQRLGHAHTAELKDHVGRFTEVAVPIKSKDRILIKTADGDDMLISVRAYAKDKDWQQEKENRIFERRVAQK